MATLLIVEDHPLNRRLLRDLLQVRFHIIEACSAEEAKIILEEATPDLILMDVQLPGMDGLTLARQIKLLPRTSRIPIIVVSSLAQPKNLLAAKEAGCADYITKPITDEPQALVSRLSRWLSASAQ